MKKFCWTILPIFFLLLFLGGSSSTKPFSALIITFPSTHEISGWNLHIRVREIQRGWSNWEMVLPDEDLDEHENGAHTETERETHETFFQTNPSLAYEFRWTDKSGIPLSVEKTLRFAPRIEPFRYGQARSLRSKWFSSVDIPDGIRIIPREEWGANPEFLFEKDGEDANASNGSNGELETLEQSSDITAEDPDIERIVTEEANRAYRWPLQYAKNIRFLVIHHTASQKLLDQPEIAIQNIYFYHAVRKGWGDIGYHFLIDPKGNIYEGRSGGDKVIGGHSRPVNKVSVGIAVLGNYEEGEIPAPVLHALLKLTKFLAKKYDIDPDGSTTYKEKTYKNIGGHRDSASTLCPGQLLYDNLFWIREIVDESIQKKRFTVFQHVNGEVVTVPPESEKLFSITLKNISTETWTSGTMLKLPILPLDFEEFQFTTHNDPVLVADLSNGPIAPGGTGIFEGKVKSKLSSGLRMFNIGLAINGRRITETPLLRLAFFVSGVDPNYEVALRHDPKNLLEPNEPFEGYIELKNTSNVVWRSDGLNRIVLATDHPRKRKSIFFASSDIVGTLEQKEVKPGENGRFVIQGKAPETPGTYTESFTPLIEGIRYLKDQELKLNFVVKGVSDIGPPNFPIRVKLSFEKNPTITSENPIMLFEGTKFRKMFPRGSRLTVRRMGNVFLVLGAGKRYRVKPPVRLTAHLGGALKVVNWENREYRDTLEVRLIDGKITIINELPLEEYLRGVAEEPNNTPREKIKALSILARTYAQFYMTKAEKFPGKPYHLDDDPRNTQKYLGYSFEKRAPNIVKAVEETKGKVVTYQGKLVKTPYFSQSDGRTRSGEEIFGWKDTLYLMSVADPDCAGRELRGHGVGLSGCGALAKALRGETAEQILTYYYAGIEILGGN